MLNILHPSTVKHSKTKASFVKNTNRRLLFEMLYFMKGLKKSIPIICNSTIGKEVVWLAKWFRGFHFHVYNDRGFNKNLKKRSNITIFDRNLDKSDAALYPKCYLISNYHAPPLYVNSEADMIYHRELVYAFKPLKSMLKFHLPKSGLYDYFDGEMIIGPRISKNYHETKIIFSDIIEKSYDCEQYHQELSVFHRSTRCATYEYDEDFNSDMELLPTWDCKAEWLILYRIFGKGAYSKLYLINKCFI